LRAAQIEGFEGVRKLNLKINAKRKEKGLEPINLADECEEDLADRQDDQYELFIEMVRLSWKYSQSGEKNSMKMGRAPNEPSDANIWDSFKALQHHMD